MTPFVVKYTNMRKIKNFKNIWNPLAYEAEWKYYESSKFL